MNFEFIITSTTHGEFAVIAPSRFEAEIRSLTWRVVRDQSRAEGRQFSVRTHVRNDDGSYSSLYLHQFVWRLAGKPKTRIVDHRDGNPLNNSELNLRNASDNDNARNRKRQSNNTSGFAGVTRKGSRYRAQIKISGHKTHIGYFATADEAARAYDQAASLHFGEFASLNFPEHNQ